MVTLKEKLAECMPKFIQEGRDLITKYGDKLISDVTVKQIFGGMRGVKGLVCDTSSVEPDKGLSIRGIPIMELRDKLPEDILGLLLDGDLPTDDILADIKKELAARCQVPAYVWNVLKAMPADSHPMCMLDTAILVMQHESEFFKRYQEGMKKEDYWEPALEDSLNIIAKLPNIAAGIYRLRFNKGDRIDPDPNLDWGANYARMLGLPDPNGEFTKLIQLYLVLHSDHEGGNVSAFTSHVVGSALSDPYYVLSAGLNGLAGPLHGLANQECLGWVLELKEKFNGVPSNEELTQFTWNTLNGGKVIPGYGHAVLRVTDPRYTAFLAFGKEHCADDPVFQIVSKLYDVVPEVLKQIPKISNPWPNVDAGSGALLYHYGMTEYPYYTVLFSVSRALGILSQFVLDRGVGRPITRPKSVTTKWLKEFLETS